MSQAVACGPAIRGNGLALGRETVLAFRKAIRWPGVRKMYTSMPRPPPLWP